MTELPGAPEDATFDESLGRRISRAVKDWTGQLVDVSGRNTLLNYRDLKAGTLDFVTAREVGVERILGGYTVRFSEAFGADELAAASRRGRAIRARAEENFEERGLRTLFLAWGMATWTNTRSSFIPCAPVLLRQAHLLPRGSAAEDFEVSLPGEWEINPTLLHVLASDFDVHVDPESLLDLIDADLYPPDPEPLFERLIKEASQMDRFDIAHRVVLANFSYAKLPMVNDLASAEDLLARSTLICAIAGDEDARQGLRNRHGDVSPSAPDFTPPADEFLVLDADSSQSYAINTVVSGADLVIDGPPGTGKSQTIANLIATLSARGKRVLFVAEKRAAIDAVLSRLEKVGLGDLVLDLHDGPGAKGKLAQQFAKSLADAATARPTDMAADQHELVVRRDALVRRTSALHQRRDPWALSVYQLQAAVIGTPESVRSEHRLGARVLQTLSAGVFIQAEADLERFVGLGGLAVQASDSPWAKALATGTITTPEQAAAVMEAMTTFAQHTLPQATQRLEVTLASVGLCRPYTLANWARAIDILHRTLACHEQFERSVFDLDFDETLAALERAATGSFNRAWHRLFDGRYRSALRSARSCTKDPSLKGAELLGALTEAKAIRDAWKPVSIDDGVPRVPADMGVAEGTYGQLLAELSQLERVLGQSELEELAPEQLVERLRIFIAHRETLFRLPELYRLNASLQAAGLSGVLEEIRTRNLIVDQSLSCLRFVWHASVFDAVNLADPEIGTFDGRTYSRTVATYRQADSRHISTTPARIRRAVAEHVIATRDAYPEESQLVTHEAGKKRRHIPVRLLFQQAPHVLTALKPCWAMSPLVVSQVLPIDRCFDVVIFDEASQVTPESAVGALMRADQAVVAGDPHQLPPTTFFASGSSQDDEEDEDEEFSGSMTKDFESVLDVMGALLPPPVGTKRLSWHYRSRDERLIAFSNAQPNLYDWSLTTFPGASANKVISYELVPFVPGRIGQEDSVADEVRAVVRVVTEHAHNRPEESLGVITMGIKHMDRINEALRRARQDDASLDTYLDEVFYGTEKFFVKNLERVQGDERDAIIISIGYGKTADGRMRYTFGPLNNKGGERRLNVAITRARCRIGVISSFSPVDMDPARLRSDGAQMLRDYLVYAESGGNDLGTHLREPDPLNPFEQDVLAQLTAAGLAIECQVGSSGYWIDFAAKHPTEPGRYVLAIEADGAAYHSSATARDRDRLRQDHLERLGWRFHRIWSTEWFHHREREVERVLAAYSEALTRPVSRPQSEPGESSEVANSESELVSHVRSRPKPVTGRGIPITEYTRSQLVDLIRWINEDGSLRTEEELIATATAELGFERRGNRIVEALSEAIAVIRGTERSSGGSVG